MINFLKNIPPFLVFTLAYVFESVGKFLVGIATVLYNVSSSLHLVLGTKLGKKLKEIEQSVANVMKMYAEVAKRVTEAPQTEDNRLAAIINNNPEVVQLRKKKNDDNKS